MTLTHMLAHIIQHLHIGAGCDGSPCQSIIQGGRLSLQKFIDDAFRIMMLGFVGGIIVRYLVIQIN